MLNLSNIFTSFFTPFIDLFQVSQKAPVDQSFL